MNPRRRRHQRLRRKARQRAFRDPWQQLGCNYVEFSLPDASYETLQTAIRNLPPGTMFSFVVRGEPEQLSPEEWERLEEEIDQDEIVIIGAGLDSSKNST